MEIDSIIKTFNSLNEKIKIIEEAAKKHQVLIDQINNLENRINNLTNRCDKLEKSTSFEYSNKYDLLNYSYASQFFQHKESLISDTFDVDDLEFQIEIFPFGVSGNSGKLSLFLNLISDDSYIDFTFKVTIVNSKTQNLVISKNEKFNGENCTGWSNLLNSRDITKKNGWLQNDILTIKFMIIIYKKESVHYQVESLSDNIAENL